MYTGTVHRKPAKKAKLQRARRANAVLLGHFLALRCTVHVHFPGRVHR